MSKIKVNGKEVHPVYKFLKDKAPGTVGKMIKWNFTKFMVRRDGTTITRFGPKDTPDFIREHIENALKA